MRSKQGFTLIEMAIVITILALIIGGIVSGKALLRSARLQTIITDVDRYVKATQLFKEKYKELPGDFANAEGIWGSDAACPNTPTNSVPKKATCNGDGDGRIAYLDGDGNIQKYYETFRVWQHLANAGMIEGQYTGVGDGTAYGGTFGLSMPDSKITSSGYLMETFNQIPTASTSHYQIYYPHIVFYGGNRATQGPTGEILTPAEALLLDTKNDDGRPAAGNIMTFDLTLLPNCATSDTITLATYNTAYTRNACALMFLFKTL